MSNQNEQQNKNNPPRPGRGGGQGMGPGAGFSGEKAKDLKGTMKKLIKYLGRYKIAILVVFVFAVGSTIFSIIGPKILGEATTELFEGLMREIGGDTFGIDFTAIANILLTLLIIYLLSALFSLVQGIIMAKISNNVSLKLRRDLNEKVHKLPFSYYDTTTNGDVLSRITTDVDSINQGLNQSITQLITSVVSIIGILVMMFSISWEMTLIALVSLPLSLLVVSFIVKRSQKYFKSQQKYLGVVNSIAEENYSCHTVVKAFNGEKKALDEFEKENKILYKSSWKANFLSGLMMPIIMAIGNFSYVVVCIVGGYFAGAGTLTVGNIQAFIQYMRSFNQPIAQLSQLSSIIQQTMAASERVFNFLDAKNEPETGKDALNVSLSENDNKANSVKVTGTVSFENVNFGYNSSKIIINNFSTTVKPGQKIAIVGPTGAGKSTIIKLLMRFYDVNSGKICLDGHDIRDFDREELRSAFGMVLQETWLFNGTIGENLRYGKLDSSDDEVVAAAKTAQAHNFIKTLPGGYDMVLNEEASNVSQGQKQLLTIARAILADPKILILDEATSSVDTRTEVLIQKAMDNLMKGRTSFIIAHRLSTIKNADIILVMKDGDIIEQGSHDELLKQEGFYANLYYSQFVKTV